ncbi:type IX secretion system protein PorG [Hymenobacter weizhouensis]|uniref:type IX secretion system protein PorG n=1 Tax=Hymenobacter sp. YIM 151500-1 TaxID=2987689 RepID=UPI0022273352|nr:DUF6089 family protein [Hymenobacter sp. YIM 151500-1]UYZ61846.1 DUF6089 family protein [Hymenobacter sp. YIM 151500-1]
MTKSGFFKTLLVCAGQAGSVFFAQSAAAQNTSELGFGLGGLSYKGEISPHYQFRNNRPALTLFYRKDISAPVTLKLAATGGMLRADDRSVKGVNGRTAPLHAYRQAYLKGSLYELAGNLEYNFFNYHDRKSKVRFTPYVFVGVAGFYANTEVGSSARPVLNYQKEGQFGLAVPAGLGFKFALSRHWNLGLEAGARKAFTDLLDHIDGKRGGQDNRVGNPNDQDWYFYNGLSLSYTFYKIRCPETGGDASGGKRD